MSRRIGYAANGPNDPDRLEIDDRVCQKIGDLSRWTSHINDQCIANGWAGYDAAVDWLPPEHWLARQFHDALVAACRDGELSGCGPDGRLLLRLRESHDEWRLEHLLVTLQHPRDSGSGADDGLRIPKPSTDARQAIPASGFARFYGQPAFGYIVCMNRGFAGKLDHATLKARHRAERDGYDPALALRTHRALSWLKRAESESRDPDARFIFLWIAFNAAYANEIRDRRTFSERGLLQRFLNRLVEADTDRLLYHMLWEQFPGPIRLLIDNQYVFQPYWEWRNGRIGEAQWQELFTRSKTMAHRALGRSNTRRVLGIVLERLYTLRNQLIHGGATWNGKVNRRQVKDGVTIMDRLVPTVIHLMLDHGTQGWGAACYPVLE